MIQLFDRAGQQIEVERTSFIAFCDEGEVSANIYSFTNIYSLQSYCKEFYIKFYANADFMALINQLHEIDSRKANTASGF